MVEDAKKAAAAERDRMAAELSKLEARVKALQEEQGALRQTALEKEVEAKTATEALQT